MHTSMKCHCGHGLPKQSQNPQTCTLCNKHFILKNTFWLISPLCMFYSYSKWAHFDQTWSHSAVKPQWLLCRNQDSSLQHWNANWWWGPTGPEGLAQLSCDSTLRPESPRTVFPYCTHNQLQQRCCNKIMGTHDSLPLQPHFLYSYQFPWKIAGFRWSELRQICHFTWGHILRRVHNDTEPKFRTTPTPGGVPENMNDTASPLIISLSQRSHFSWLDTKLENKTHVSQGGCGRCCPQWSTAADFLFGVTKLSGHISHDQFPSAHPIPSFYTRQEILTGKAGLWSALRLSLNRNPDS